MAIFKRHDQGDVQQVSASPTPETGANGGEQTAKMMPPFVSAPRSAAPGVVPPPAAPTYTLVEGDSASLVAEKVKTGNDAQPSLQESVRVAVQRARTTAPARSVRRQQPQVIPQPSRAAARQTFDPTRAAQAGLLNLAWNWQQAGAPIRAIHAYMQVLSRYPDTPAADAAVADLVEISDKLAGEGQFHIALGIYDQLEQLL